MKFQVGKVSCCIIIVLVLLPLGATSIQTVEVNDPIIRAIFNGRFTAPIEIVYCLMSDGVLHQFTNNSPLYVNINGWILYDYMRSIDKDIKNCVVVIHNHVFVGYFSTGDKAVLRSLKRYGFQGRFLLYIVMFDKYYELKD